MPATQPLVHLVEADTCPQAWLQAAEFLESHRGPAYNLVLAVRSPAVLTAADFAVYDIVNGFLREHGSAPLTTVASTIFPANFYLHGGAEELYNTFPQVYAHVRDLSAIYAIRMLRKPANSRGAGSGQINPLQIIVEKIKKQSGDGRMRAVYEANLVEDEDFLELPIYDALCDARRTRCQPCLTHLSFKLLPDGQVMLTVLYRYHSTSRRRSAICSASLSCCILWLGRRD